MFSSVGLGRVELPTSRLSGCPRQSLKSGRLLEYQDIPSDLSGGRGPDNGTLPAQTDTATDTTHSSGRQLPDRDHDRVCSLTRSSAQSQTGDDMVSCTRIVSASMRLRGAHLHDSWAPLRRASGLLPPVALSRILVDEKHMQPLRANFNGSNV